MPLNDAKTWVDIISGLATAAALILGGGWFLLRRSLAGTLRMSASLRSMTQIDNNHPVAIVRVKIKNIGQTRIKLEHCEAEARLIEDKKFTSNDINRITYVRQPIEYKDAMKIFTSLTELEPNEETYEDVGFVFPQASIKLFAVGVRFVRKRTLTTWQTTAILHIGEKPEDEKPAPDTGETDGG